MIKLNIMRTKLLSFFIIVLSIPCSLMAQSEYENSSKKLSSIYDLQQKMYRESNEGPLTGKRFGVEVNPLRLLWVDKATTFSGSFSLFDVTRFAEISFPVYFQSPKNGDDLTEFTLDAHYRYFLGKTQNGFYLSGFARYAFLNGTLNFEDITPIPTKTKDSQHKLGIGFGIGYRIFSERGLYWGTSLSVGRYVTGSNNRFYGDFLTLDDDNEFIVDIEVLKFGWAF